MSLKEAKEHILIEGGNKIEGNIFVQGAKNASLPIMVGAMLTEHDVILENIPKLSDIYTMKELLDSHGALVEIEDKVNINNISKAPQSLKIRVNANKNRITSLKADYDIVKKMRASIWILGALLARFGRAEVAMPGGCTIGARLVNFHIDVLTAMNVDIKIKDGYISAKAKANDGRLEGCNFTFDNISVGATINAILAASLARGVTKLYNCAIEPEVIDFCNFLNKIGASICNIGTRELVIIGKKSLEKQNITYSVMPDRIEAGTYMIAGAITKGNVNIIGIKPSLIEIFLEKLVQANVKVDSFVDKINGREYDVISISSTKRQIKATNISTSPYPGFPTDLQAQFMTLMTIANGTSVITENIFENRLMHVPELNRMGANITIMNKNTAVIKQTDRLNGANVMASDLRASVSLIIAGLVADGKTIVSHIHHLDRGYFMLEEKLSSCNASIKRILK